MKADDPRWEPETQAFLQALERYEAAMAGYRRHLVNVHGSKDPAACDCGGPVPQWPPVVPGPTPRRADKG